MPYRRLPNSTPAVIRTLKNARDTYKNTPVAADRAISAEQFAQLDNTVPNSLLNRLLKEANDVDLAQAAQAPLTNRTAQEAARLTTLVSHFHQVFDLGTARGTFAIGARSYYGRDVSATTIPDISTYDALDTAAENIGTGESARGNAEGIAHVAMSLPSAAEVTGQLGTFRTFHQQSEQAQVNTDSEQEDVSALYPDAHTLAVDICDTVEFFYRKEPDDASRRAKCMRWGVVYIYEPSEPLPANQPNAVSLPPAPPTPQP